MRGYYQNPESEKLVSGTIFPRISRDIRSAKILKNPRSDFKGLTDTADFENCN